jgi:hypothetical protein
MSNVEDIFGYAWNKDAASLKGALDSVMQSRVADAIGGMYQDVAASAFGSSNGEELPVEEVQEITPDENIQSAPDSIEGIADENV